MRLCRRAAPKARRAARAPHRPRLHVGPERPTRPASDYPKVVRLLYESNREPCGRQPELQQEAFLSVGMLSAEEKESRCLTTSVQSSRQRIALGWTRRRRDEP